MHARISARPKRDPIRWPALAAIVLAIACSLAFDAGRAEAQPGVFRVSAGGPYAGRVGETIIFRAGVDFGGRPPTTAITFSWDFGDGAVEENSGQTTAHTYSQPGNYVVTVTLFLLASRESVSDTAPVQVTGGQMPGQLTASAGGPYTGQVGSPVFFMGRFDLGGRPPSTNFTLTWDFGDGATDQGQTTAHTYSQPGTYVVTFTIAIPGTNQVATDRTVARISGAQPGVAASAGGPYSGTVGQPITMSGSVTPAGLAVREWLWNFGDGTTGSGQTVQKTYSMPGTFTVTLEVRPANEGAVTVTTTATVTAAQAQTDQVPLPAGCSNQALTWPVGTPMATVANAVSPPGIVQSIFRLDSTQNRFRGFSPSAPAFANDYTMVEMSLEAVFFCLTAPGTLNRPAFGGGSTAPAPMPTLVGPVFRWQGTLLNDGQQFTPANPANYTLQLAPDGTAAAQVDCNRAVGSYTVSGNRLTLTFLATTLVACPPGSLADRYLQQLNNVSSFFFQNGQLVLELMFDSGGMRFTQ